MTTFQFCCIWMTNTARNAGEKGFAVMAMHEFGERKFALEARSDDGPAVRTVRGTGEPGADGSYAVSMLCPLRFCPGCGANLADLIARDPDGFDRLAAQQRAANPEFALYDRSF